MVKPIGDKLIVKLDEIENKTAGGIIIPDAQKDKTTAFGTVIALGSAEFPFKVGDRVIFDSMAGTDIKIDGEKHLVMKDFNVMGVIE